MLQIFKRDRLLTTGLILTLAIGVGVTAATFNLVDALLFRSPPHVAHAERLVRIASATNYVQYDRLKSRLRSVEIGAYTRPMLTTGVGASAILIRAECVTESYFQLLGTAPAVGHSLSTYRGDSASGLAVVLAYGMWQRTFAGDPTVVGRSMGIAGKPYIVIGVAPRDFAGVDPQPVDVWLALTQSPELCAFNNANLLASDKGAWLRTIGRIRDPFTLQQAEAELTSTRTVSGAALTRAGRSDVEPISASRRVRLSPESRVALWLAAGAFVVLLIACANVAVLMALRAMDRRLEIAVRIQLGATATRVFMLFFFENLALSLPCILGAVVVALWTDAAIRGFLPSAPGGGMSARSFSIVGGFALFAGIASAIIPALQVSRANAAGLLRSGQQIVYGGSRIRNVVLIAQLALAQILLIAGGLFLRSVHNLTAGAGYDLEHVVVATIELERHGYATPDIWVKVDEFVQRCAQLPSVSSVSTSSATLLGSGGAVVVVGIRSSGTAEDTSMVMMNAVSGDYFATLGTRILRGRAFTSADDARAKPVVVVDQGLADQLWPGENPVGKCAMIGTRSGCIEVIGVSEPRRSGHLTLVRREFFVPSGQSADYELHTVPRTLLIRSRAATADVIPSVVAVLQGIAPEVPAGNVRPLLDLADQQTRSWRLGARAFGFFGALAAAVASAGLYGALALAVRQRTPEIAVRMVLGARAVTVVGLVIHQALWLLAAGSLAGTVMALLLAGFIQSLLFEIAPTDLRTHAYVTVLMCAVGLAGCAIPAVRAAHINPAVALRQG